MINPETSYSSSNIQDQLLQVVVDSSTNSPWEARIEIWHGLYGEQPQQQQQGFSSPSSNNNQDDDDEDDDCRIALDVSSKHSTFTSVMNIMPSNVLVQQHFEKQKKKTPSGQRSDGGGPFYFSQTPQSVTEQEYAQKLTQQYLEVRVVNTGSTPIEATVIQQPQNVVVYSPSSQTRKVKPNPSLLNSQSNILGGNRPQLLNPDYFSSGGAATAGVGQQRDDTTATSWHHRPTGNEASQARYVGSRSNGGGHSANNVPQGQLQRNEQEYYQQQQQQQQQGGYGPLMDEQQQRMNDVVPLQQQFGQYSSLAVPRQNRPRLNPDHFSSNTYARVRVT
jgi:hypothetical protein